MSGMSACFLTVPQVLSDPAGPLSSELSPSAIAEANAAVNSVQPAKTKETKKREVNHVHYTCVQIWHSIFGRGCGMFIQEVKKAAVVSKSHQNF